MLIIDEATAKRRAKAADIDRTREITLSGADNEARDQHMVADKHRSVANHDRQAGKKYTGAEFIAKLQKINPDITLNPHPGYMVPKHISWDKGILSLNIGGLKTLLFVCEYDWMPEWSIMTEKTVRVPEKDNPAAPWKEVKIPRYVEKRGWREVLAMLVRKGLIGLEATERVFGAGDRPSWKILTGKGQGPIF